VHSLVDDHSRVAYSELHPDETAATVTAFVQRGLAFFASLGITPRRVMSDNAWAYTRNRSLAAMLADHGIKHLRIPPRRPQVNGKVERYQQTLKRECALGQIYRSSQHRADALTYWLRHYNEQRPHSALGGRPPITRAPNLLRQDI
jgi:transposase InsO family protein